MTRKRTGLYEHARGNTIKEAWPAMKNGFRLSVAIPLRNEEAAVPELLRRVGGVLERLPGGPHEIVLVDDGSTDGTLELLERAADRDRRLVVIALSRNFGHQAALTAALDHVSGDATVVMDADLQDAPEAIPQFVKAYEEGYDVVYAQRLNRKEIWWLRVCYFLFYRLLTRLSETPLPTDAGDFSLMSKRVVEQLRRMPEHHRYLRGLRSWVGFRQSGIPVERSTRYAGRSNYSLTRLFKLAADGLFAFSVVPLRLAAIIGVLAIVLASANAMYQLYVRVFLDRSPAGFTALIWVMTFLSGTILVSLGLIGEYVGRLYEELKARPIYIINKVVRPRAGSATVDAAAAPIALERG